MNLTDLKPYPEYRESGHVWLGTLPSHWPTLPNRALFAEIKDRNHPKEQMLSVTITKGVIGQKALLEDSSKKDSSNENKSAYKLVWPRDIAYNKMRAWQGAIGASDLRGIVSPAYIVMRPRGNQNSRYFHYLFRTPHFAKEAERWSYGITSDQWSLRAEHFKMIYSALPAREEQEAVVRFVFAIDQRITRLIRTKRGLIRLLNEQKEGIVQRAVTHGINPHVPLKSTGIRWLGDIPEHWNLSRVKNEFQCLNNRRIPLSGAERGTMTLHQYDYYGASGIIDKVDGYLFDDDLLLIAEDGANLVLRNLPLAIIARGKFWVNNHAHILKPKRGKLEYLANLMEVLDYSPWISGAAQPKLTKDRLMAVQIPVPPPAEQEKIQDWIKKETAPLEAAIAHAKREIDLIREYRTRLVSDVVTGQLDVREAAASLPDEQQVAEVLESAEELDVSEASTAGEPDAELEETQA